MEQHLAEAHEAEEYWPCETCDGANFKSWKGLLAHNHFAHNKGEIGCLVCLRSMSREERRAAPTDHVTYGFAGTVLTTPYEFLQHKMTEHMLVGELGPYQCGHCGKRFKANAEAKAKEHLRTCCNVYIWRCAVQLTDKEKEKRGTDRAICNWGTGLEKYHAIQHVISPFYLLFLYILPILYTFSILF